MKYEVFAVDGRSKYFRVPEENDKTSERYRVKITKMTHPTKRGVVLRSRYILRKHTYVHSNGRKWPAITHKDAAVPYMLLPPSWAISEPRWLEL